MGTGWKIICFDKLNTKPQQFITGITAEVG